VEEWIGVRGVDLERYVLPLFLPLFSYYILSLHFIQKYFKNKRGGEIYLDSPPSLIFFDFLNFNFYLNPFLSPRHFVIGANEWHHSKEHVPLPHTLRRVGPTH